MVKKLVDLTAVAEAAGLPGWWGRRLANRGVLDGVATVLQDGVTSRRYVAEDDVEKAVEKFRLVAPAVRRPVAAKG